MGQFFQIDKGVAMGSPISGTMAEIFLQLESTIIKHLSDDKIICFYNRYVDNILLIYDNTRTNPDIITKYVNSIHNNIQLNPSTEINNTINFLDISITRNPPNLKIGIYCKPTTTDTTINFLSNHPCEHKMASYQFLIRRMLSLPLDMQQQHAEWQYIRWVAQSNNFPPNQLSRLRHCIRQKLSRSKTPPPSHATTELTHAKWTVFTFSTPLVRKITNLFKQTNVRISFRCNNTLFQHLKPTQDTPPPPSL
jgi:hypothetical protein